MSAVLLVVFLVLPWIRINGHPAVLLDFPNRRFALFGLLFWAHEAPLLIFVIGSAIVLLALVTAVWGRVWCGWGCPQTVFVDAVFRRIERWIEGDSFVRRRLDQAPWNGSKVVKKTFKWGLFIVVSFVISHSFLAYFVGPEALGRMMQGSPAQNPAAFGCMLGMFAAVLFDFGWFREQFCTVVCPYGRFQSVMMDDTSQTVAYDGGRGEPRRGTAPLDQPTGDCVNCFRCVQVCPTGIDIRRGLQLECIACTACIDACDEVMTRIKKPKGLIRYASLPGVSARAWIYAGILVVLLSGLGWTLMRRQTIELEIVRAAETPYQELVDGKIINHFKLDLQNQSFEEVAISFSLPGEAGMNDASIVISNHAAILEAGQAERADLFVQFPKSLLHEGHVNAPIVMNVTSARSDVKKTEQKVMREVRLVGPYR